MLLALNDLSSSIARLCVSPEGTRLAVANNDGCGEVLVIELPSGKTVAHYTDLAEGPRMAFRSESELLIVHGLDCWLCNLSANSHRVLPLPEDLRKYEYPWLSCCRPSPDGGTVALGGVAQWLGSLYILDLVEGNAPRLLAKGGGVIEGIQYSSDGGFMATVLRTDEGERWWRLVRVLDARSGETVRDLKLPQIDANAYATAFHPGNRILAAGWWSNVLLFDLYPPPSPLDPEVLFGPDWTGLPMGWARPTAFFPLGREQGLRQVDLNVLRFSADGSVLKVLCQDGEAVLMSASDGQVLRRRPPPTDCRNGLYGADVSTGGHAAAGIDSKTILTWEVSGWGAV